MGAVYLIRHGQASFGSDNYDQLSDTGRSQAKLLGQYLGRKGLTIDHWFSGTLERQKDTASIALSAMNHEGFEVLREPGFNEFDHIKVMTNLLPELAKGDDLVAAFVQGQGDRKRSFQPVFERVVDAWVGRDSWPDMESWPEFVSRVNQALERVIDLAGAGKNVAVVTSGGPISAVLYRVLGLNTKAAFALNWAIVNTSITKIFYSADRRSVGYFNNYSYLQRDDDRSHVTFR